MDIDNIDELEEALDELFPNGYSIDTDSDGKIIVYTNLIKGDDGELLPFNEEESDDFDPDTDPLEDEDVDDD